MVSTSSFSVLLLKVYSSAGLMLAERTCINLGYLSEVMHAVKFQFFLLRMVTGQLLGK